MPVEGERRQNRQTGQVAVYQGGRWVTEASPLRQSGPSLRESTQDRQSRQNAAQQAISSQGAARDAQEFMALNEDNSTGGVWSLPVVQGTRAAFDPEFSRMRSIQERLTPSQREAGSGAMSDRDVEMYRRATLNVGTPREANQANAAVIQAGARNAADYSAFLDEFARANNGSLAGATEQWMNYSAANPLFDDNGRPLTQRRSWRDHFNAQRASSRQPAPQRQATSARPSPANNGRTVRLSNGRMITPAQQRAAQRIPGGARGRLGTQTNPRLVNSREEVMRLPRGTHFIDENGLPGVRP